MKVMTKEWLLFSSITLDFSVLLFLLTCFGWAAKTNKSDR